MKHHTETHKASSALRVRSDASAAVCLSIMLVFSQLGVSVAGLLDSDGTLGSLTNRVQYQRWRWVFDQRAYPLGDLPSRARVKALDEIKKTKQARAFAVAGGTMEHWINIGPAPILGGQTTTASSVTGSV